MKYKVGDKVVVRTDLLDMELYHNADNSACDIATEDMLEFSGQTVTITRISDFWGNGKKYRLKEDEEKCTWTDEMFADKAYEDIVEQLAKYGNSTEEIQRTYERYLWHIEKFEGLENKNKELETHYTLRQSDVKKSIRPSTRSGL